MSLPPVQSGNAAYAAYAAGKAPSARPPPKPATDGNGPGASGGAGLLDIRV